MANVANIFKQFRVFGFKKIIIIITKDHQSFDFDWFPKNIPFFVRFLEQVGLDVLFFEMADVANVFHFESMDETRWTFLAEFCWFFHWFGPDDHFFSLKGSQMKPKTPPIFRFWLVSKECCAFFCSISSTRFELDGWKNGQRCQCFPFRVYGWNALNFLGWILLIFPLVWPRWSFFLVERFTNETKNTTNLSILIGFQRMLRFFLLDFFNKIWIG